MSDNWNISKSITDKRNKQHRNIALVLERNEMKKIVFILGMFLIGCNEDDYKNKSFIIDHTETYFIPDSNKQKYSDFVSKSVSGCEEDCRYFLDDVRIEAGKIYGIEIVEVKVRSGKYIDCDMSRNCFDSVLLKNELNNEQIEATKNYFVKEY